MRNLTFENLKMIIKKRQEECFNELKREIKKMERDIETFIARFCESTTNQATREYLQSLQQIFGRALAREVERDVTPVRPRIIQDSGFADGMNKMNSGQRRN